MPGVDLDPAALQQRQRQFAEKRGSTLRRFIAIRRTRSPISAAEWPEASSRAVSRDCSGASCAARMPGSMSASSFCAASSAYSSPAVNHSPGSS